MKTITLFLSLLISGLSFAEGINTKDLAELEDIAKELRQREWAKGYEEVQSNIEFVTKDSLSDYYKRNLEDYFYEPIYSEDFSKLYRCHYSNNCSLYLISVSSEYWSAYGESAHFVLLSKNHRVLSIISHIVYEE